MGHNLVNDLKVLLLSHPKRDIRDTAEYAPLRRANGAKESLKNLAKLECDIDIQQGEHSSVRPTQGAVAPLQMLADGPPPGLTWFGLSW